MFKKNKKLYIKYLHFYICNKIVKIYNAIKRNHDRFFSFTPYRTIFTAF